MALSKIDFANAANIMRLRKSGAQFDNTTMEAARRVLQGTGTSKDAAVVRQQLGIFKTGSTKAKLAIRDAQRAQATIVQVGTSIEQISRGGGAATVGFVNLVRIGTDEIDKMVRSRTVRTVFEQVGKKVFGDIKAGTQAYQSFRGAMRIGGAVVQAALMGWDIGKQIQGSRDAAFDKLNLRQGLAFDQADEHAGRMLDWERSRRQINAALGETVGEEGSVSHALRAAGFDTGFEDQLKQQAEKHVGNIISARGIGEEYLGTRFQDVLSRAAQAKGKTVAELTAYERAQIIDDETERLVDTHGNSPTGAFDQDLEQKINTELALQTPAEKAVYQTLNEHQRIALRRRIALEKIIPARIRYYDKRAEDREIAAEKVERNMSAPQRLENRKAEQIANAQWLSVASRHKAWQND